MSRVRPLLLVLTWLLLALPAPARAGGCEPAESGGPLRVYLLTLNPADDLFSKIGHSALWVSGGRLRSDLVFNWGAFNSRKQDPVAAFLDGRMLYHLDLRPFSALEGRARRANRTIIAQRLDLPADALRRLVPLLEEAAEPENREYQYHWAENNCATRIRDLLDTVLDGALHRQLGGPTGLTWRSEVLRHLSAVPWAWFGWDFLAAAPADEPINGFDSLFVPDRLMHGLAEAEVDGRPLVGETCTLVDGPLPWPRSEAPTWWPWTTAIGLLWAAGIGLTGRRVSGLLAVLFGLLAGAMGSITAWLAATSAIEGLDHNVNWFVANPGTLLLLPIGLAVAVGVGGTRRKVIAAIAALLALVGCVGLVVSVFAVQHTIEVFGMFLPPLLAAAWAARPRGV